MIHDEKTTELELTKKSNVVHVSFDKKAAAGTRTTQAPLRSNLPPKSAAPIPAWMHAASLDNQTAWLIRLLAVLFIALLSILVL